MTNNKEIINALPPEDVMDALIKMKTNADTLIQYGDNPNDWEFYEDSLIRHCHLFLKRLKAWHKTRKY